MRTIETKVYFFSELSEKGKEKAIENLSNINVDHEWWQSIFEDAEQIGLQITTFDLSRNYIISGELTETPETVIFLIRENHGDETRTYKLADKWQKIVWEGYGIVGNFEEEFKEELLEEYLSMLRKEYEYLTSEEAIIEIIEANKYEFTEDGKLV